MGFWSILGNIAMQIGLKLTDAILSRNDDEEEKKRAVEQPNWNNVVDVCDGIYSGNLQPIDSIGNMRRSLYEQDPQVLKLALKVLEGVIEERGIPVRSEQEATQFLRDMRELLRDTRDRDVMNGVFELNDAWTRACGNSPAFRGVGDLVEMLNSEGYRVLITRDNRNIINENVDASYCSSCEFQLPFRQLKHFCQYCNRIFCSNCCSYERGIAPFQDNASVCICCECKTKNNTNSSSQATSDIQTVPKVNNNIRSPSTGRNGLQNIRVGNVKNNEEDVQINLVVPRHIAEDSEGWTISVQCSKTENSAPVVTAQTDKKENNDVKLADEYSKDKLFEKDIWQDNSDSKEIVTKSAMETRNMYLPLKRQSYGTRQDSSDSRGFFIQSTKERNKILPSGPQRYDSQQEEDESACRLNNSKAELEDEELKLALELSRQTQMEEMEVRRTLEISQKESENMEEDESACRLNNSKAELEDEELKLALELSRQTQMEEMEVRRTLEIFQKESENTERRYLDYEGSDEDESVGLQDNRRGAVSKMNKAKGNSTSRAFSECREGDDEMYLDITERKYAKNNTHSGKGVVAFEVCSSHQSGNQHRSYRSKDCWEESGQQNAKFKGTGSDEDDANLQIALRRSLKESARTEERSASHSENDDDDLQGGYAYNKTPGPSYDRNRSQKDEKDALIGATEEHFKSEFGKGGKKSEENWEVEDALKRAIQLSLKENKRACYNCGKKECECDEGDVLLRAVQLAREESVKRQLSSRDIKTTNPVSGKDSNMESTGKPPTDEQLRQKRLRYFEQENAKEDLESLAQCSEQDSQFPERCEKECDLSDAARKKIAMIEEEEIKLAIQLSLQETLKKEEKSSEESADESNSDGEGDDTTFRRALRDS